MFSVGSKAKCNRDTAGITDGKIYKIMDVYSGWVDVDGDDGKRYAVDATYFTELPCGGFEKNDSVQLKDNGKYATFTVGHTYTVLDIDISNGFIELANDLGAAIPVSYLDFAWVEPARKDDGNPCLEFKLPDDYRTCSCDFRELLMYGCRCGGFEAEKRRGTQYGD